VEEAMKLAPFALLFTSLAQAATSTIPASNFGFYNQSGTSNSSSNHAVGYYATSNPAELRNYFTFNVTGLAGKITAAKLRAFNPSSPIGYSSPNPTETYTLFDVSTPLQTLVDAGWGNGGVRGFRDWDAIGFGDGFGGGERDDCGSELQRGGDRVLKFRQ
jgi:hypothetical protein